MICPLHALPRQLCRCRRDLRALWLACALAVGACGVLVSGARSQPKDDPNPIPGGNAPGAGRERIAAPFTPARMPVLDRESLARSRHGAADDRRGPSRAGVDASQTHSGPLADLLQVWWSEAGPRAPLTHAAMAHVIRRHARRNAMEFTASAEAIVWRHSDAKRRHAWVRHLNAECERPDHYGRSWSRVQHLCERMVARARAFFAGQLPDPCPEADGWRTDRSAALAKAIGLGWRRVACAVEPRSVAFVAWRKERVG